MRPILLALLGACNSNDDDGDDGDGDDVADTDTDVPTVDTDTDPPTLPTLPTLPVGWLRIRVDRPSEEPFTSGRLDGARVFLSGLEATTDNQGLAEFVNVGIGPHGIEVRAQGIPQLYSRFLQQPDTATAVWIEARDTKLWTPDAADGGAFVDGPLTLELPPAALLDPGGLPVVGPVDVSVLAVDPDSAAVLPALVGPTASTSWLGFAGGYMRITANQQDLTISAPLLLTLPVFVPPGAVWEADATPAVQRFDVATGRWVEAGLAVATTPTTVTVSVDTAGWWLVGELREEHCVTGRVVAEATPVRGAYVRVTSPDALVHGSGASLADGLFCACGPVADALRVDAWALRAPADELIGRPIDVPAVAGPSTCDPLDGGATAVGDLVTDPLALTCASGTLDPAVPGCSLPYAVFDGADSKVYDGMLEVGDDGDPAFCLTVPADLGDGGIQLSGAFAVFTPVERTCAMAQCAPLGTVTATCP